MPIGTSALDTGSAVGISIAITVGFAIIIVAILTAYIINFKHKLW